MNPWWACIRGARAPASLKPIQWAFADTELHSIRGARAPASLKPSPRHPQVRVADRYPGRARPGLIEAPGASGDVVGFVAVSGARAPRPH